MRLLNFMIVGAQKSGTTALASFLDAHPDIEMSDPKEVHAFDQQELPVGKLYKQAFTEAGMEALLLGEATPVYMYFNDIPRRLREYNPRLRIIVILRDPVERAYSQYVMESSRGDETLPYWLALLAESGRLKRDRTPYDPRSATRHLAYRSRGLYSRQLAVIYGAFPTEQVLVIKNEALKYAHQETLNRVFGFLGVRPFEVMPGSVFSQDTHTSDVPLTSYFLRKSYRKELKRLARIVDFSVQDWY